MIEFGNLTGIVVLFLTSNRGDLNHESWGTHHHWRLSPYGSTQLVVAAGTARGVFVGTWTKTKCHARARTRHLVTESIPAVENSGCHLPQTYHLGMVYKVYTTSLWWFWGWFIIGFTMVYTLFTGSFWPDRCRLYARFLTRSAIVARMLRGNTSCLARKVGRLTSDILHLPIMWNPIKSLWVSCDLW